MNRYDICLSITYLIRKIVCREIKIESDVSNTTIHKIVVWVILSQCLYRTSSIHRILQIYNIKKYYIFTSKKKIRDTVSRNNETLNYYVLTHNQIMV